MTRGPNKIAPASDPDRRFVFTERLRCPACKGVGLRAYKTVRADDSTTRYTQCRECGHRFLVVEE